VLSPDLVGPSITRNAGIIGEAVDLSLEHLGDMRASTLAMHLTKRLLYTRWRDPNEQPKLHLFGQLKRITKEWIDQHIKCVGNTYPAQLMYEELADMACERITAAINRAHIEQGQSTTRALLDPYNPVGSTRHVNFATSKAERWDTSGPPPKCHLNWAIPDSDWESEFCRVAEAHPKVVAYVKNHNLGFEVPYRMGAEPRRYRPDFILRVDDGRGPDDPLNLVVEIKGYRGEDAKAKKEAIEVYWVPGINGLGSYGRWAFAEFTEVYAMQEDFGKAVDAAFGKWIDQTLKGGTPQC
jgi:type III restriction enzyme